MNDLFTVRREIQPLAQKNAAALDAVDAYAEVVGGAGGGGYADVEMGYADEDEEGGYVAKSSRITGGGGASSPSDIIIDIREYDVPYYLRVAIDKGRLASVFYR